MDLRISTALAWQGSFNYNNTEMKKEILSFISELRQHNLLPHCALIYLFGSEALQKATPESDIDIAVLFGETPADREELIGDMREIGARAMDMPEELIDIQVLNDSPLAFQIQVISKGLLIYSQDSRDKELYESQVMSEYLDYLYYEDIHYHALQERIGEGKFGYRPEIIVPSSSGS